MFFTSSSGLLTSSTIQSNRGEEAISPDHSLRSNKAASFKSEWEIAIRAERQCLNSALCPVLHNEEAKVLLREIDREEGPSSFGGPWGDVLAPFASTKAPLPGNDKRGTTGGRRVAIANFVTAVREGGHGTQADSTVVETRRAHTLSTLTTSRQLLTSLLSTSTHSFLMISNEDFLKAAESVKAIVGSEERDAWAAFSVLINQERSVPFASSVAVLRSFKMHLQRRTIFHYNGSENGSLQRLSHCFASPNEVLLHQLDDSLRRDPTLRIETFGQQHVLELNHPLCVRCGFNYWLEAELTAAEEIEDSTAIGNKEGANVLESAYPEMYLPEPALAAVLGITRGRGEGMLSRIGKVFVSPSDTHDDGLYGIGHHAYITGALHFRDNLPDVGVVDTIEMADKSWLSVPELNSRDLETAFLPSKNRAPHEPPKPNVLTNISSLISSFAISHPQTRNQMNAAMALEQQRRTMAKYEEQQAQLSLPSTPPPPPIRDSLHIQMDSTLLDDLELELKHDPSQKNQTDEVKKRRPIVTFNKKFRKLFFNIVSDLFLNSGSYGATPKCVLRARAEWERLEQTDPQRWRGAFGRSVRHTLKGGGGNGPVGSPLYFNVKRIKNQLALLLHTNPKDMALLVNCNGALSTVLKSLPWEAGDTILLLSCDYDATFLQAEHLLATYGVETIIVPVAPPIGDEALCRTLNAALLEIFLLVGGCDYDTDGKASREDLRAAASTFSAFSKSSYSGLNASLVDPFEDIENDLTLLQRMRRGDTVAVVEEGASSVQRLPAATSDEPKFKGKYFTAKRRPKRFPRFFTFSHVTSRHGWIFPARAMTAIAHRYGMIVCVDGAQAAGHFDVNIPRIGCEFYMGTGHKWLYTVPGTAFLVAAPSVQMLMTPLASQLESERNFRNYAAKKMYAQSSWGQSGSKTTFSDEHEDFGSAFEAMFAAALPQYDMSAFLAMEQSLGFLSEVCGGIEVVAERGRALAAEAIRYLSTLWDLPYDLMWSPHDPRHPCHIFPLYGVEETKGPIPMDPSPNRLTAKQLAVQRRIKSLQKNEDLVGGIGWFGEAADKTLLSIRGLLEAEYRDRDQKRLAHHKSYDADEDGWPVNIAPAMADDLDLGDVNSGSRSSPSRDEQLRKAKLDAEAARKHRQLSADNFYLRYNVKETCKYFDRSHLVKAEDAGLALPSTNKSNSVTAAGSNGREYSPPQLSVEQQATSASIFSPSFWRAKNWLSTLQKVVDGCPHTLALPPVSISVSNDEEASTAIIIAESSDGYLAHRDQFGKIRLGPRHDYDRGKPMSCLPLLPIPASKGCTTADAVKLMGYLLAQGVTSMIVVIEDATVAEGIGGSTLIERLRQLQDTSPRARARSESPSTADIASRGPQPPQAVFATYLAVRISCSLVASMEDIKAFGKIVEGLGGSYGTLALVREYLPVFS